MTNYSEMTNEQLDRLVAEKVMGFMLNEDGTIQLSLPIITDDDGDFVYVYWRPTTNIAQAFEVVDKMIADGWLISMIYTISGTWLAIVGTFDIVKEATDKSLPRAICIAALMAKESEDKDD